MSWLKRSKPLMNEISYQKYQKTQYRKKKRKKLNSSNQKSYE